MGYTSTQAVASAQDMCDMQEYAWHAGPCLDEKERSGRYVPVVCLGGVISSSFKVVMVPVNVLDHRCSTDPGYH